MLVLPFNKDERPTYSTTKYPSLKWTRNYHVILVLKSTRVYMFMYMHKQDATSSKMLHVHAIKVKKKLHNKIIVFKSVNQLSSILLKTWGYPMPSHCKYIASKIKWHGLCPFDITCSIWWALRDATQENLILWPCTNQFFQYKNSHYSTNAPL